MTMAQKSVSCTQHWCTYSVLSEKFYRHLFNQSTIKQSAKSLNCGTGTTTNSSSCIYRWAMMSTTKWRRKPHSIKLT